MFLLHNKILLLNILQANAEKSVCDQIAIIFSLNNETYSPFLVSLFSYSNWLRSFTKSLLEKIQNFEGKYFHLHRIHMAYIHQLVILMYLDVYRIWWQSVRRYVLRLLWRLLKKLDWRNHKWLHRVTFHFYTSALTYSL